MSESLSLILYYSPYFSKTIKLLNGKTRDLRKSNETHYKYRGVNKYQHEKNFYTWLQYDMRSGMRQ